LGAGGDAGAAGGGGGAAAAASAPHAVPPGSRFAFPALEIVGLLERRKAEELVRHSAQGRQAFQHSRFYHQYGGAGHYDLIASGAALRDYPLGDRLLTYRQALERALRALGAHAAAAAGGGRSGGTSGGGGGGGGISGGGASSALPRGLLVDVALAGSCAIALAALLGQGGGGEGREKLAFGDVDRVAAHHEASESVLEIDDEGGREGIADPGAGHGGRDIDAGDVGDDPGAKHLEGQGRHQGEKGPEGYAGGKALAGGMPEFGIE
jgi:hypothetical protein